MYVSFVPLLLPQIAVLKCGQKDLGFFGNVSEFTIENVFEVTFLHSPCGENLYIFSHWPRVCPISGQHISRAGFTSLQQNQSSMQTSISFYPSRGFSFLSSVQASLHCLTDSLSSSFEITRLIFHLIVYLNQNSHRVKMYMTHVTCRVCLNFSRQECMLQMLSWSSCFLFI